MISDFFFVQHESHPTATNTFEVGSSLTTDSRMSVQIWFSLSLQALGAPGCTFNCKVNALVLRSMTNHPHTVYYKGESINQGEPTTNMLYARLSTRLSVKGEEPGSGQGDPQIWKTVAGASLRRSAFLACAHVTGVHRIGTPSSYLQLCKFGEQHVRIDRPKGHHPCKR